MATIRRSSAALSSTSITSPSAARALVVRGYRVLFRAVEAVVIGLLAALAVVVAAGVFWRYALNDALSWTDEVGGILLVWLTYLGAAVALDRGAHLDMDLLAATIRGRARTALRAVVDASLAVLLLVVLVNGWSIASRLMDQTMVSLPVPRGAIQLVMPLSAVLMLLVLAARWLFPEATRERRDKTGPQIATTGPLAPEVTE